MKTLYFKVDGSAPDPYAIEKCAGIIKNGGIVIFPTETVYGIGVNALDENAVRRLYGVKKRPFDKPLLMHIQGLETASRIGVITPEAEKLVKAFTPGPLTVIVKKRPGVIPDIALSGGDTVGLRFPSDRVVIELAKACGVPLAATSANFSGAGSAASAMDIDGVAEYADAVIDGGRCECSLESTIVSVCSGRPRILRQGAFPRDRIEEVIGICD